MRHADTELKGERCRSRAGLACYNDMYERT
jgi:hypothetical protein